MLESPFRKIWGFGLRVANASGQDRHFPHCLHCVEPTVGRTWGSTGAEHAARGCGGRKKPRACGSSPWIGEWVHSPRAFRGPPPAQPRSPHQKEFELPCCAMMRSLSLTISSPLRILPPRPLTIRNQRFKESKFDSPGATGSGSNAKISRARHVASGKFTLTYPGSTLRAPA